MKQLSTKDIDNKTLELRGLISKLREKLSGLRITEESLNREADDYRRKSLRLDDEEATNRLTGLKALQEFTNTEIGDIEKEISHIEIEIADLAAARTVSLKDEHFAVFTKESRLAVEEAKKLDTALSALFEVTRSHRDRLTRMSMFLRESGVDGRTFDSRHLWRKIQATLHSLSPFEISRQNREYDKSYSEILQHLIDIAETTRHGSAKAVNE